jgi:tyrosyl-tRNA synthetase
MQPALLDDLQQRGLVHQVSAEQLAEHLAAGPVTLYSGFDPSADSLHVGHLLPLLNLRRFQLAGHRPIGLVGGGTGLIGDPSGKQAERLLQTRDQVDANVAAIRRQVESFLDFDAGAMLVNNLDWLGALNLVDFLRDIGKHFSVNQMIVRDSVRQRLEAREQGLSYTEFSYMLLQAYDFLALFDRYGCTLQTGGSDQWGNIVSGVDLVRRLREREVYGMTFPLLTQADGSKFGKTEKGSVWLDPERTSPYQFYQFWLNTDDRDVIQRLKFFTFEPLATIADAEAAVTERPESRAAQRLLAESVTRLVHGPEALARAQKAAGVLFNKQADLRGLSGQELREAFQGAPTTAWPAEKLASDEAKLVNVLAEVELYPSRGRARKDIPSGGVSVNNVAVKDPEYTLSAADLLPGGHIILRKGKKSYHVLRVAES